MRRIRKRLGEMLVEAGLLAEEQMGPILAEQKGSGMRLGDFLIHKGIVSEDEIISLLSTQLQIGKYDPNELAVGPELASLIPYDLANKYLLAPLSQDDFVLRIAMVDPMDLNALDMVEKLNNIEVEPLICSKSELAILLNGIYGIRSSVSEVLDELGELEIKSEDQGAEPLGILRDIADAAPIIRLVNSILHQAVKERASDVHISPEQKRAQVRFRIDGKMHEVPPPPRSMLPGIVSRIKILASMDIANTRIPQDGRFNIRVEDQEISLRVSTLPTIYGENLVMRLLYISVGALPLEKLGFLAEDLVTIRHMARQPYGMILSAGPTGSGKSSSLYALLNEINTPEVNIITLEDPVEYRMDGVRQVQLNTKAGMTFASGLRSILRQDPNIIMVGEIRDNETASIAIQAALTGHLVLSTIHTNDSAGTVTRLDNMGIEPFLISASLLCVCAQRLLRRICARCAAPFAPPPAVLRYWGLDETASAHFQKGTGCSLCMNTGYKGRTGIYEILAVDDDVRAMILTRVSSSDISRRLRAAGKLRLLRDIALAKVIDGITTFEEAAETVLV
ncbi:MAG: GspE/PulE family protein [Thermodesulfobacteriota bacterium]